MSSILVVSMPIGTVSAQPSCRTAVDEPEFAFAAGCMIRNGDLMLAVRQRSSGKLSFPAGFAKTGESAQCVAHRETWEETGLDVVVHSILKQFRNGFALYRCELLDLAVENSDTLTVPTSGLTEVSEVIWIDPRATKASDWRFPRDYPVILELIEQPTTQ